MAKYILQGIDYGRDLDAYIPNAPNFQYWEVVSSPIAVRLGIKNIPTEAQWRNAEIFAVNVAQPIRNKVGRISFSSWFRNPQLNTAVQSGPTSYHLTGGAGDLEPAECTLMELLEEANKLHYSEIIAEYFPHGWVHVAYLKGDDRKKLKLKDPSHNSTRITIEELRKLYPNVKVA